MVPGQFPGTDHLRPHIGRWGLMLCFLAANFFHILMLMRQTGTNCDFRLTFWPYPTVVVKYEPLLTQQQHHPNRHRGNHPC